MQPLTTKEITSALTPELLLAMPIPVQLTTLCRFVHKVVQSSHTSFWKVSDDHLACLAQAGIEGKRSLTEKESNHIIDLSKSGSWQVVSDSLPLNSWFERSGITCGVMAIYGIKDNDTLRGVAISLWSPEEFFEPAQLSSSDSLMTLAKPIFVDAKEVKALRERTLEQDRLTSLGSMVASIAHEVNNPLGVAITSLSHLKESLTELESHFHKGNLTEELFTEFVSDCREVSSMLDFNLQRAAKLIRDFKSNAVHQSADVLTVFDISHVINSVLNSVKPQFKHSNIELVLKVNVSSGTRLKGFPGALSQVITNLLFNAMIHAFDGIAEPNIEIYISETANCDDVAIHFKDNGKGIPAELQKMVFEPYFTTRRVEGGSGLGLFIVRSLVEEKMQGKMEMESATGKGTHFIITLPLSAEDNVESVK